MCCNKVFDRCKTFFRTRKNREFNRLAGRARNKSFHTGHLSDLRKRTSGSRDVHIVDRSHFIERSWNELLHIVFGLVPDFDIFSKTFLFGQKTFVELTDHVLRLNLGFRNDIVLTFWYYHIINTPCCTRMGCVLETKCLHLVENTWDLINTVDCNHVVNRRGQSLSVDLFVDKWVLSRKNVVEKNATDGRLEYFAVKLSVLCRMRSEHFDLCTIANSTKCMCRNSRSRIFEDFSFADISINCLCNPIAPKNDIKKFCHDSRIAVSRLQNVFVRCHDLFCFHLCFFGKWHVDGHLVSVEIGVESGTDKRVYLDSITFDQNWTECLNTKTVQCRCAVQQNVFAGDHFFENSPHFWRTFVDETACATDIVSEFSFQKARDDKRTEKFERHVLWQSTLVKCELRTDDDHRTTRVVDTLTEQVLSEKATLAFNIVRK